MRYPASEKLEIIRLVEQSHLPTKRTLEKLGIPKTTSYRWYDRYLVGGPEALEDRRPTPSRVWNRIPTPVREKIKDLALKESELSPRELAFRFTDTEKYFVSEASVYRILKSYDLITSPAYYAPKLMSHDHRKFPNRCCSHNIPLHKVAGDQCSQSQATNSGLSSGGAERQQSPCCCDPNTYSQCRLLAARRPWYAARLRSGESPFFHMLRNARMSAVGGVLRPMCLQ